MRCAGAGDVQAYCGGACGCISAGEPELFPVAADVLRVWPPPGYGDAANATRKYKVMYMLDGQSLFDACTAFMHEEMRADETLTELITAGKMEPIIVVGVDNGSTENAKGENEDGGLQRTREYIPYPDPVFNPSVKDVVGDEFAGFMETEVMPAVAAKYRVLTGPTNTAIEGVSYGGVAAVYALIRRPDLFGAGSIESPSMQVGNGQMLRDTVSLFAGPRRVAFGVGTAEATDEMPNAAVLNAAFCPRCDGADGTLQGDQSGSSAGAAYRCAGGAP